MVTPCEQISAKMMSKNAQNRSKLLEIARILSLASARTQICVLTVCQQQRWQVLEHCANSRIRAGVGPKSVPTADPGVPTLLVRTATLIGRLLWASSENNIFPKNGGSNRDFYIFWHFFSIVTDLSPGDFFSFSTSF